MTKCISGNVSGSVISFCTSQRDFHERLGRNTLGVLGSWRFFFQQTCHTAASEQLEERCLTLQTRQASDNGIKRAKIDDKKNLCHNRKLPIKDLLLFRKQLLRAASFTSVTRYLTPRKAHQFPCPYRNC